jgi:hypothetical protein
MSGARLKDEEAKKILLGHWPSRPRALWGSEKGRAWLRAQPVTRGVKGPRLKTAGSDVFRTQPDGLWVRLASECADAMVVEVCGSGQNFFAKRSRYAPSTSATLLTCPREWLAGEIAVEGGGRTSRWEEAGIFQTEPTSDLALPIRNLKVLYFLPADLYRVWKDSCPPAAHEFFAPQSSMRSFNAQAMQTFLERMTPESHFYSTR